MNPIARHVKPIMLVSGTLTATMLYAALAPAAALTSTFGESLSGPLADLVVRNWGVLVALVGAMLVYGAFDAGSRRLALTVAALSKLAFIALVLSQGSRYLPHGAGIAIAIDTLMVILFSVCLFTPLAQRSKSFASV
jgi:hypothetical protein